MEKQQNKYDDPLWKLSAVIAEAANYCGPLRTRVIDHPIYGKQVIEGEFIYGFQHAKATEIIHNILEQELPKLKKNYELSLEDFTNVVKGTKS